MPKQKRQPGIHLHKTDIKSVVTGKHCEYYWILISKNGNQIAGSKTYKRKSSAVRSIEIVANHFENNQHYTDHTSGTDDTVVYKIKSK